MQPILMLEKLCVSVIHKGHMHLYEMGSCVPRETYTGDFLEDSPGNIRNTQIRNEYVVILGEINRQSIFHFITQATAQMSPRSTS